MSATQVYLSGDTPSPLPPIPGQPGVGVPPHGDTLPVTGFDVGILIAVAALILASLFLAKLAKGARQ